MQARSSLYAAVGIVLYNLQIEKHTLFNERDLSSCDVGILALTIHQQLAEFSVDAILRL